MPIRTKYRESIKLMKELGVSDLKVWEEDGALKIRGRAKDGHDKMMIEHKIEEENLDKAMDVDLKLEIEKKKPSLL